MLGLLLALLLGVHVQGETGQRKVQATLTFTGTVVPSSQLAIETIDLGEGMYRIATAYDVMNSPNHVQLKEDFFVADFFDVLKTEPLTIACDDKITLSSANDLVLAMNWKDYLQNQRAVARYINKYRPKAKTAVARKRK